MIDVAVVVFIVVAVIGTSAALLDVTRRKSRWALIADLELMRDVRRFTGESGEKLPGQVASDAAAYRTLLFGAQIMSGLGLLVAAALLVSSRFEGQTAAATMIAFGFLVLAALLVAVFAQASAMFGMAARRLQILADRDRN